MLEQLEGRCPRCQSLATVITDRTGKILHEDVCFHYQGVVVSLSVVTFIWSKE